jgi:oligoribonuclease NrnB/cAMP/cGMP phosphodiesterase (DHH superfamily)
MTKLVKHFTDSDLDGYGCRLVGEHYLANASCKVDVEHATPANIDEKVNEFLRYDDSAKYDYVFITDLSVNEEVAELIDRISENTKQHIVLIDHHKTARWLNKYSWAIVKVEHKPGVLASGTSLFLEYLKMDWKAPNSSRAEIFAEMVRKYDTWEWYNVYQDDTPKKLNDLLGIYGGVKFCEHVRSYLNRGVNSLFGTMQETLLEIESERIAEYIKQRASNISYTMVGELHVAMVYADRYQSEIGNTLARELPHADAIAIVDMNAQKVSLRASKGDVDVAELAKQYNGGGHSKASGFTLDSDVVSDLAYVIFHQ